jgi:peptidyl-Lys metalloendopeptidase
LFAPQQVLRGDVDVRITVTVTNVSRQPVSVPAWYLPSDEVEGALFSIARDNRRVGYLGPMVKRGAPQAADMVRIEPGVTLTYEVELTAAYDLAANGHYVIQYDSRGVHGQGVAALRSPALHLWLEGRSGKSAAATAPQASSGSVVTAAVAPTYTNCTATQQSTLNQALAAATNYASGASTYMSPIPAYSPRYVKWFGARDLVRESTVRTNFGKILDAFSTKQVAVDCKCRKNYYAYVYPSQPYKIYVCSAFWAAPMTGTDSKAGTLIHEMSHFNVVASTDDWAYGQTNAASLAISNPAKAIDNADSYEYFAENTPTLQ